MDWQRKRVYFDQSKPVLYVQQDQFSNYQGYQLKDASQNPKGNSPLRLKNQAIDPAPPSASPLLGRGKKDKAAPGYTQDTKKTGGAQKITVRKP